MKRMKRLVVLLLTATLLLSLAACGNNTGPAANSSQPSASSTPSGNADNEKPKLKELTLSGQPYSHTLPVYIAQKEGMFDKAGLEVELLMFTGGAQQNEALGAGEWEIGTMGSPPSITGGKAYGVKVIAFGAPDTEAVTIWARPDSEIAQIKGEVDGFPDIYGNAANWKGKTILCPTSTSAHFTLIATLKKFGLTSDDVNIIDMGVAQGYTAFKAGEADIVCLWDPQGFYADENEDWICISSGKATGEVMPTVVVASKEAIEKKPDEVLEWLDTYLQASEKYAKDFDTYAQLLLDFGIENGLQLDYDIAYKSAVKRPLPTLDDEIEWFSGAKGNRYADKVMENLMDFFVYTGSIEESDKQNLISNGFIDGSFVEKLAERYNKSMK